MGADYHYSRDGQSLGPVSVEVLRELAAKGQLSATDLVWKEGMAEWVPAGRFKGLIPAASVAPAAPVAPAAVDPSADASHEFRLSEPAPAPVIPQIAPPTKTSPEADQRDDESQAEVFARQAKVVALAASSDALKAFKTLATNPIGGLRTAVDNLGTARAMQAGIVFAVIFELCVVLAGYSLMSYVTSATSITGARGQGFPMVPMTEPPGIGFTGILKLMVAGLVPFGAAVGGFAAARAIFKGRGTLQSDMFVAGASLLPAAITILAMRILGPLNFELVVIVFVFAVTTTVLLLYSGFTTLEGIPDTAATLVVPLIILADMYICKIILFI